MKERIKTTHEEIREYWEARVYESDMGTDWAEALNHCWRCGKEVRTKSLHRCHIIPADAGGEDKPENLILLCRACHDEAPSLEDDKTAIWEWIKKTSRGTYAEFLGERIIREFELIFGRKPKFKIVTIEQLNNELGKVGLHLGALNFSYASYAFALKKAGA